MPKYDDFNLDLQSSKPEDKVIETSPQAARASCLTSTPRRPCCMIE